MPPYKLPDHKSISAIRTCSTPGAGGANEIRFDDAKGKEQLLLFAQNSLHVRSQGARFDAVGGDSHEIVAGDAFKLVKKSRCETVNLDFFQTVKGDIQQLVEGKILQKCLGEQAMTIQGALNVSSSSGEINIDGANGLTLSCGGNFIKIDQSGITILGNVVNINSGGSMGALTVADPHEASQPLAADSTQFGHNVNYSTTMEPQKPAQKDEQDSSWIEIELVDELGKPVPNEEYALKLPDGKIIRGTLNEKGLAHVLVPKQGTCQISFPNLDAEAWEPIG